MTLLCLYENWTVELSKDLYDDCPYKYLAIGTKIPPNDICNKCIRKRKEYDKKLMNDLIVGLVNECSINDLEGMLKGIAAVPTANKSSLQIIATAYAFASMDEEDMVDILSKLEVDDG